MKGYSGFPKATISLKPHHQIDQCHIQDTCWAGLTSPPPCRDAIGVFYSFVPDIGLAVRVFANGPGDLGSIPGRVIPKTQKMVLDASLLNTQHYKVRIKGKVGQSREGVAPSPTLWCSSYRKGSLRVTLDYGRQLYFTLQLEPPRLVTCFGEGKIWIQTRLVLSNIYKLNSQPFILYEESLFGYCFNLFT